MAKSSLEPIQPIQSSRLFRLWFEWSPQVFHCTISHLIRKQSTELIQAFFLLRIDGDTAIQINFFDAKLIFDSREFALYSSPETKTKSLSYSSVLNAPPWDEYSFASHSPVYRLLACEERGKRIGAKEDFSWFA